MSDQYIQRLRDIRDDFDIAREVFAFVTAGWARQDFAEEFRPRTKHRIERAAENLETTFFIRLAAEFEAILKDHLRTNHPDVKFPAKQSAWKLDWFLSRILQKEKIVLTPAFRQEIDEARDRRNALAHGDASAAIVNFKVALARYNTLLAKIPDPHT